MTKCIKKESLIKSSHRKNVKTKGDKSTTKIYNEVLCGNVLLITIIIPLLSLSLTPIFLFIYFTRF